MNKSCSLVRAAPLLASLALLLCGCETDGKLAGTPPLSVTTPTICERLLADVALPPITAKEDAHVAWAKDDAALRIAAVRIAQGRGCIVEQRELYAAAGDK
jgi:hypothetical protein